MNKENCAKLGESIVRYVGELIGRFGYADALEIEVHNELEAIGYRLVEYDDAEATFGNYTHRDYRTSEKLNEPEDWQASKWFVVNTNYLSDLISIVIGDLRGGASDLPKQLAYTLPECVGKMWDEDKGSSFIKQFGIEQAKPVEREAVLAIVAQIESNDQELRELGL
jgi:hypothetical protein